jgi:hypothetical protein
MQKEKLKKNGFEIGKCYTVKVFKFHRTIRIIDFIGEDKVVFFVENVKVVMNRQTVTFSLLHDMLASPLGTLLIETKDPV